MLRVTSCAAAIVAASATIAFAGGTATPPPAAVVIAPEPPSLAFEGPYAGLEFGLLQPSLTEDGTTDLDLDDGSGYGLFAGYNIQNGSLVYGGELRYVVFQDAIGLGGAEIENVIDLRARVGFAASEQLMVYGAAGYSMADATNGATSVDLEGFSYGIGMEYNINERLFLGADFTGRDLEGDAGGLTYEGDANTATLRLGLRF